MFTKWKWKPQFILSYIKIVSIPFSDPIFLEFLVLIHTFYKVAVGFFFIFEIPGGLLFISKEKTTVVSPALSRNMNQTCVLGIFDKHDLWHFLSAAALFFYFLLLLVIDDGIFDKPRNEIYIFWMFILSSMIS